jgi:hypothetical protein
MHGVIKIDKIKNRQNETGTNLIITIYNDEYDTHNTNLIQQFRCKFFGKPQDKLR